MKLEIDIPEHHYNNIMALDSVSLGRVPYKGIIMYTINAIKHGKVLEQEPTTKNDLGVDCISRETVKELISAQRLDTFDDEGREWANIKIEAILKGLEELPSVTPQEPKTGHWIRRNAFLVPWKCSECNYESERYENYCPNCGAKMVEPKESEG